MTIGRSLARVINTRRKFLIWTILFFLFCFIFGFNQTYLCKLIYLDESECSFILVFCLPLFLAVILSLLIDWFYEKLKKK